MKLIKPKAKFRDKVYTILGATNHSNTERQAEDYYASNPKAMELLLKEETFSKNIWECACGEGHLSKVLENAGYNVISTDLIYRGYGEKIPVDFLSVKIHFDGDIITNPPYKYAVEFCQKAIYCVQEGHKVAMLLRLLFLEGKSRKKFFEKYPPKVVYIFSSRIVCAKNGEFEKYPSSAIAYAWFVWEKNFKSNTIIKWIN